MKGKTKRILSTLLTVPMTISLLATPVYAAPLDENEPEQQVVSEDEVVESDVEITEEAPTEETPEEETPAEEVPAEEPQTEEETKTVEESFTAYTVNADAFDFSEFSVNAPVLNGNEKIDDSDPSIAVVEDELDDIKVLNADGEKVPLTEEQKQQVLYLYSQYIEQWKANANILGVQLPFYLSYNDKKDELGILGEMLVLANVPVDAVRSGDFSFDDLTGMIMNFLYGDQLGIKYYGKILEAKRDEFFNVLKKSGAKTDAQKLLILNDWLARQDSFDMSYIMNSGKDEPIMVAENPKEHPHKQDVYNTIKPVYEKQIGDTFRGQFKAGIEADMRQKYYEGAIHNIVMQGAIRNIVVEGAKADGKTEEEANAAADAFMQEHAQEINADPLGFVTATWGEEAANQVKAGADKFMADNNDAIKKDAPGFVAQAFGEEVAAQLAAGADQFIEIARTEGVEVQPDVKMTIDQLVENEMATNRDIPDLQGMTPNEAIPVFADQAAQGLTGGILNYWEGNHFGALAEGKSVCLGYAKAYAWLMQCMYPEIYGVNGAGTDMTKSENWKTAEDLYYDAEGNIDTSKNYNVDLVRITFNAKVTMYGQVQPDFNSDHFWNAVQLDGKWYYVDPCYTDTYSEVMVRDRVEMDGYINHMYYMFSHSAASELYEGYFKEIKTLYADKAVHRDYEKSWMSRVKSDTLSDGKNFYYVYDSMDMIQINNDFNNNNNPDYDELSMDSELKLVRHAITDKDAGDNGDSDYEALIEFNHKVNEEDEDDDTTVARVRNKDGKMEENKVLTDLFAKFKAEREVYPSINITAALHNNKLYFNLSNYILSYDLNTCEVKMVKEYTTVYGTRDKSIAFGGMAFSMNEKSGEFAVEGHPIASMSLKEDGKLHVSIATNFAYISGKDAHNSEDKGSFGYEFEESNFNPKYNYYQQGDMDFDMEQIGYSKEKNDNDEFMWVANFVGTEDMGTLEGAATEIAEDFEVPVCDHHFVKFEEEYYTKVKDSDKWNTGHCYVCPECGYAVDEPQKPKDNAMEEVKEEYEKQKALYDEAAAKAGHKYTATDAKWAGDNSTVTFQNLECTSVCKDRKTTLDCLLNDKTIAVALKEAVTAEAKVVGHEGECETGAVVIYEAAGTAEDVYKYSVTNRVEIAPGKHTFSADFTWEDKVNEETKEITPVAKATKITCAVCEKTYETLGEVTIAQDEAGYVAPKCEEAGKAVYVATVNAVDENGKVIDGVTATSTHDVVVPATGHDYKDGFCTVCGEEEPSIVAPVIESVYSKKQDTVKVTFSKVDMAYGYQIFRAEAPDAAEGDWKLIKTIKGDDVEKYTKDETIQYTNVNLEVGKTFYYKVRSFKIKSGAEDVEAEESRIYSDFSTVEYMPAAVVFDNVYSNSTERVRMLWNQVKGSHGYQIWRMNDDGTYSIVKTLGDKNNELTNDQGATTAYSNTGLESGKTYTYKMRAFSIFEGGKKVFGAYSDEIKVAVMPKTPKLSGSSPKAGRAALSWNAVSGAAGYQVWMSDSKDGKYSIVKSITDGKEVSYTKYDLKSGSTYSFKVRAYTEIDGKKTFGAYTDVVSVKVK